MLAAAIGCTWEEAMANAQLIAAAPDLLKALETAFELLEEHGDLWYLRKHFNTITAAIEKATGV